MVKRYSRALVSDSFFGFGWCNCNPIPTRNKKSKSNKVTKFDDNYKRRLKTHGKDTLYFKYQNWQFVVQDSEIRTIELSDDKKIYNKKDVIEILDHTKEYKDVVEFVLNNPGDNLYECSRCGIYKADIPFCSNCKKVK